MLDDDERTIIAPMVFCDCPFCAEEAVTESEGDPAERDGEVSPELRAPLPRP